MLAFAGFLMLFATGENGTLFFWIGIVLILSHFSVKGRFDDEIVKLREWLNIKDRR